jgi:hypothetical protein
VQREGDTVAVLGKAVHEPDPTAASVGFRHPAVRVVFGDPPDGRDRQQRARRLFVALVDRV